MKSYPTRSYPMRSYLSLVPISAKVHRRRNRMVLMCIAIAVFLVTAIFSIAEMGTRMQKAQTIINHGNWHVRLENLSESTAEWVASHKGVLATSWYEAVNLDMDKGYAIGGVQAALCGIEQPFITDIMHYFSEGASLQDGEGMILSMNAKELLGVKEGDSVTLDTPAGSYAFTISGFRRDDSRWINSNGGESSALLVGEDQIGAFVDILAFRKICDENQDKADNPTYYVQLQENLNIGKAFSEIKEQCGLTDVDIIQNKILMTILGLSASSYLGSFYTIAAILFVLILLAGIFMISSSLNSNIAQRTQFFGMMRCIGAGKRQIIRFVRLEALSWCKGAIPTGAVLGVASTWGICAILKYVVGGEWSDMPVFGLSAIGIISGIVVAIVTVLIAAQAPAKRASKVSPVAAVSGSAASMGHIRHAANTRLAKIETALGMHHAVSTKKNLILMTGSFAFSIIMFLSFSVLIEMVGLILPQKLSSPNMSIMDAEFGNTLDEGLVGILNGMPGVKEAFGRTWVTDVPATFSKEAQQETVDLISFDECELSWLPKDKDLRSGSDVSKVYGDSGYVLSIYDKSNPLETGDKLYVGGAELEIAGMLKSSPFSNDGTTRGKIDVICSKETFVKLTGEHRYSIIDIHVEKGVTEQNVAAIRSLAEERGHEFQDRRSEDSNTYWAFMLFAYGFLAIIALISVLNIMNSISMSVSARIKQYGAMRAVGMDGRQLRKMIAAEAYTYAFFGCLVGCAVGLPISWLMHSYLITAHFGDSYRWSLPVVNIAVVALLVAVSAVAAVHAPAKRIRNMAVADTINEL